MKTAETALLDLDLDGLEARARAAKRAFDGKWTIRAEHEERDHAHVDATGGEVCIVHGEGAEYDGSAEMAEAAELRLAAIPEHIAGLDPDTVLAMCALIRRLMAPPMVTVQFEPSTMTEPERDRVRRIMGELERPMFADGSSGMTKAQIMRATRGAMRDRRLGHATVASHDGLGLQKFCAHCIRELPTSLVIFEGRTVHLCADCKTESKKRGFGEPTMAELRRDPLRQSVPTPKRPVLDDGQDLDELEDES